MSLEYSRQVKLPEDIDTKYNEYKKLWTSKNILTHKVNRSIKYKSTLKPKTLNKAINFLISYLKNNFDWIGEPKILEPFAGNGIATKLFYDKLIHEFSNIIIKSTDIQDLSKDFEPSRSYMVEYNLSAVETIEKYGNQDYNILLMVSPPPSSTIPNYADYFTIKKWSGIVDAKLIVFVGELGASDGSEGLYQFMLTDNPDWKLDLRELIYNGKDIFNDALEKEIFIFKRK